MNRQTILIIVAVAVVVLCCCLVALSAVQMLWGDLGATPPASV